MSTGGLYQTCTPVLALTSLRRVTVGESLSLARTLFLMGAIRNKTHPQLLWALKADEREPSSRLRSLRNSLNCSTFFKVVVRSCHGPCRSMTCAIARPLPGLQEERGPCRSACHLVNCSAGCEPWGSTSPPAPI